MEIKRSVVENRVVVEYVINDKELQILEFMKERNFLEFRTSYTNEDRLDTTKRFRYSECTDLIGHEFLIFIEDAWHDDYKLGELGIVFLQSK